jgi:hypothetical protein
VFLDPEILTEDQYDEDVDTPYGISGDAEDYTVDGDEDE